VCTTLKRTSDKRRCSKIKFLHLEINSLTHNILFTVDQEHMCISADASGWPKTKTQNRYWTKILSSPPSESKNERAGITICQHVHNRHSYNRQRQQRKDNSTSSNQMTVGIFFAKKQLETKCVATKAMQTNVLRSCRGDAGISTI